MPKKLTQAEFLAKAVAVHGVDRYDYSQAVYGGSKCKITIYCPAHGVFQQAPNPHLKGVGCPRCGGAATLTTDSFVARAELRHGTRYDYSEVICNSSKLKVRIICREHGLFEQLPSAHLFGQGCPRCGGVIRKTTAEFITLAKAKFGSTYDYSQVVYRGNKTKVLIGCPYHGSIWQTPANHLLGYGCKKCGLGHTQQRRTYDKLKFIAKAEATHGKIYDYTQVVYAGCKQKVSIRCVEHGLFEQLPAAHVFGQGCPQCAREQVINSRTRSQADFVNLAKKAHAERYDYSLTEYVTGKQKVIINCPEHGPFKQQAQNHIMGQGCPHCGMIQGSMLRAHDTAHFITVAQAAHGNRYDYSQATYVRGKAKVKIICPTHGLFEQAAADHMKGHGCRACAWDVINELNRLTWIERAADRTCILYLLRVYRREESFFKIGITCQSVEMRYKSKVDLNGYAYEILAQHTSQDAARIYDWEQSILETFAHLRYHPKRSFGGETECFHTAEPILQLFPL